MTEGKNSPSVNSDDQPVNQCRVYPYLSLFSIFPTRFTDVIKGNYQLTKAPVQQRTYDLCEDNLKKLHFAATSSDQGTMIQWALQYAKLETSGHSFFRPLPPVNDIGPGPIVIAQGTRTVKEERQQSNNVECFQHLLWLELEQGEQQEGSKVPMWGSFFGLLSRKHVSSHYGHASCQIGASSTVSSQRRAYGQPHSRVRSANADPINPVTCREL